MIAPASTSPSARCAASRLRRSTMSEVKSEGPSRRDELLGIAAELFAEHGFNNTTVRDIADGAGILSGSLYHHFDSKESMVDEILRDFLDHLFGQYRATLAEPVG